MINPITYWVNRNTSLALLFIVSIIASLSLIFLGFNIAVAILIALTLYAFPSMGLDALRVIIDSFDARMLNTSLSLAFAMILANLYRSLWISGEITRSLESIGPRFASMAMPAIIGLLPMPAGAYVSATMISPVYEKMGLTREEMTYLNYWFRHIWVVIWPLYQNIILASAILGRSFIEIISHTWIIAFSSLIAGLITLSKTYKEMPGRGDRPYLAGLKHLWPFPLIATMSIVLNIPLYIVLLMAIALFVVIYRPSKDVLKNALKNSMDITLIALVIVSLIFGNIIKASGVTDELVGYLSNYSTIAVFTIPFIIVLATGFEFTFVVLAFPALMPILNDVNLTLAFLGGYTGAMVSPSHACLVMSARYFKARLTRVYRYIAPSIALTIVITLSLLSLI
ncbi:MAG: DUF401 family protein [Desulfurococcaceae archaeon]